MDRIEALIHDRWKRLGFSALLPEEQGYVAVWSLAMEVNNGGFDQYFRNSSGDVALLALDTLGQSGADETHSLLAKALSTFEPLGGYDANREQRLDLLNVLPTDTFDALDSEFYEGQETFMSKVLSLVARLHPHANV